MGTSLVITSFIFLCGAVLGSFLNVVILRLPQPGMSVAFPASHCPKCKHDLAAIDNVPIFSFLFLKGKCRYCQTSISYQYPLVELSMAILTLIVFAIFGFTLKGIGNFFFCAMLLVIFFIDAKNKIIPDVITLSGCASGVLFSFLGGNVNVIDSIIGIIAGGAFFLFMSIAYMALRKREGLGGGDIKFIAMLGAWLGWESLPTLVFLSAVTGIIFGTFWLHFKDKECMCKIPYGPFLSTAGLICLFFQTELRHFGM